MPQGRDAAKVDRGTVWAAGGWGRAAQCGAGSTGQHGFCFSVSIPSWGGSAEVGKRLAVGEVLLRANIPAILKCFGFSSEREAHRAAPRKIQQPPKTAFLEGCWFPLPGGGGARWAQVMQPYVPHPGCYHQGPRSAGMMLSTG